MGYQRRVHGEVEGYFNYRCQGPEIVTPEQAAEEEPVEEETSTASNEEVTAAFGKKIEEALGNSDYNYLARLILESTTGTQGTAANAGGTSKKQSQAQASMAKAVASLLQKKNSKPK